MPLLVLLLGIRAAAPLVAMTGSTLYAVNLLRHRQHVDLPEVGRLAIAAALGVPAGVWILSSLDSGIVEALLGVLLVSAAIYSLWQPTVRHRLPSAAAYPVGFLAGCLGGAYNTPGPPLIVYGALKEWPRDVFRSVLQALFLFNGLLVILVHAVAGNLTAGTVHSYILALPALLLGVGVGTLVDRRLSGQRFRLLISCMILMLGVSLLL